MTITLQVSKLVEIFVMCDDFCKKFSQYHLENGLEKDPDTQGMSESEIMSIVIFYHLSGFRCFKYYYMHIVCGTLRPYFPNTYSYPHFVAMMKRVNFLLYAFLCLCRTARMGQGNYIDATKLVVCHNKRIPSNRVFKGIAQRGKSSTGWFFGFKLHAIINNAGQLVVLSITPGNVSDANPDLLQKLTERLKGFLYGDAGYISSLANSLKERGLTLITKLRGNMKPQHLTPEEKYYLQHRGLIESAFNLMKNFCDIDHSRHRSPLNFFVNIWAGLIAYTFLDHTPSIPEYRHKIGKDEFVAIAQNIVLV